MAGLIHGLQQKRCGNKVTILEQEPGERHSHHAGIGFGTNAQEFLRKYDMTGLTPAFASHSRRWAYYIDAHTGRQDSIDADMVIGADGVNSTVRQLVNAPVTKKYAGYVAWRATIPEKLVSKEAVDYFSDHLSLQFSKRTYLVW